MFNVQCHRSCSLSRARAYGCHMQKALFPGSYWVYARECVLGPFLYTGCTSAAWVHGGSLDNGVGAGRRCLAQRVGACVGRVPLAVARTRGGGVRADAWGAGLRGVLPRCGVGHAWTLGLVRRPVALSGLLRRSSSGAWHGCCVGGGYSTEGFLTMRALRVARS